MLKALPLNLNQFGSPKQTRNNVVGVRGLANTKGRPRHGMVKLTK